MMVSDKGHFQICQPDSAGRFHADVAFPDSTTFKIGFANLKIRQRAYLKIHLDQEKFLPASNLFSTRQEIQEEEEEFHKGHDSRYFIENGEKIHLLKEVNVNNKPTKKHYSDFDHWADDFRRFDSAQIANMEGENLLDVIKKLPDVMVVGEDIYSLEGPEPIIPSKSKKVLVFINGFPEEPVWLSWRPKKYLLSVNYIDKSRAIAKNTLNMYKHDSAYVKKYFMDRLIWVVTSNDTLMESLVRHSVETTPLGVSFAKEFYQPRYDVDSVRYNHEQRDNRATLYWEPRLAFRAGEEKKIHFYTNDKRGIYFVVIEGITREGVPIRQVQRIKLE